MADRHYEINNEIVFLLFLDDFLINSKKFGFLNWEVEFN